MDSIPIYISGTFLAIVTACVGFVLYAVRFVSVGKRNFTPTIVLTILCIWIFLVSTLTFNRFFKDFSLPPRLLFFVGTCVIAIIALFAVKKSRIFLNQLPISSLTYIHIVRVPVEVVLLWLGATGAIPMELTFEGANFDILSGITAPFVGVFMIGGRRRNKAGAIIWNLLALALFFNFVVRAISYTPYFYDAATGNLPANVAVFHFPFILLPTIVAPIVLFSHLVSLHQLIFGKIS